MSLSAFGLCAVVFGLHAETEAAFCAMPCGREIRTPNDEPGAQRPLLDESGLFLVSYSTLASLRARNQ